MFKKKRLTELVTLRIAIKNDGIFQDQFILVNYISMRPTVALNWFKCESQPFADGYQTNSKLHSDFIISVLIYFQLSSNSNLPSSLSMKNLQMILKFLLWPKSFNLFYEKHFFAPFVCMCFWNKKKRIKVQIIFFSFQKWKNKYWKVIRENLKFWNHFLSIQDLFV